MYDLYALLTEQEKIEVETPDCSPFGISGMKRIHLLGLGDVGGTLLTGLKLLGGDCISTIGIYNNGNMARRYEYEMNQTSFPWEYSMFPEVELIDKDSLFQCDVFVFCASKSVPPVGDMVEDVRMIQFEANRQIITEYAKLARKNHFQGLFAVVSDPVDPLCRVAYYESNCNSKGEFDGKGLGKNQVQGYGLGVMNSRAAYFAKKDSRFELFLSEGRAFGPHGKDLVIANSINQYNDELSCELTTLAVEANLKTRQLGYKPYIAPALSSGAISIILTVKGAWHYSSVYFGSAFLGTKNRMTESGVEVEVVPLPKPLFQRIHHAYETLKKIR